MKIMQHVLHKATRIGLGTSVAQKAVRTRAGLEAVFDHSSTFWFVVVEVKRKPQPPQIARRQKLAPNPEAVSRPFLAKSVVYQLSLAARLQQYSPRKVKPRSRRDLRQRLPSRRSSDASATTLVDRRNVQAFVYRARAVIESPSCSALYYSILTALQVTCTSRCVVPYHLPPLSE